MDSSSTIRSADSDPLTYSWRRLIAVLSSLNGDDGTSAVTQGAACVVGGAGTLITYLAQVFANNVVDNNVVD